MDLTLDHITAVKDIIYSLDLKKIESILRKKLWSKHAIAIACRQYLNYLYLCWRYPEMNLIPSDDVRTVWEEHILLSKEYSDFCSQVFSEREDAYLYLPDATATTTSPTVSAEFRALYEKEFKTPFIDLLHLPITQRCFLAIKSLWKPSTAVLIIASIIANIIILCFLAVRTHNNIVMTQYSNLANALRNVSYARENLYLICQDNLHPNIPKPLYFRRLFAANRSLRSANTTLSNRLILLEEDQFISADIAKKTQDYIDETNQLIEAGWNVCEKTLMGYDSTDNQRVALTNMLYNTRHRFLWATLFINDKASQEWFVHNNTGISSPKKVIGYDPRAN